MLNIDAHWSKPLVLVNGIRESLIYTIEDDSEVPETPGAYVFVRIHGKKTVPLYIGETAKLRTRLWQHLKNQDLMERIRDFKSGQRAFMFCKVRLKKKQNRDKVLEVLQRALIEHALSEGHYLVNAQLTKTPLHSISFKGNRHSEQVAPRIVYVS